MTASSNRANRAGETKPRLLTSGQAAKALGVDPATIRRWLSNPEIQIDKFPGLQRTPGGHARIPASDVERLMNNTPPAQGRALLFLRVPGPSHRHLLDKGLLHLTKYALGRGYQIHRAIQEVGEGFSGDRELLNRIRQEIQEGAPYEVIVVEDPNRLFLFGAEEFFRWAQPAVRVEVAGPSCSEAQQVYEREFLLDVYYPLADALSMRGYPPEQLERIISDGLEAIAEALGL